MISDILLVILALAGFSIASFTDLKSREVPDFLSYSLIISAFSIRLITSIIYSLPSYFLYSLLGFLITSILGLLMYFTRQWGGGDTKLLFAAGILFATKPFFIKESTFPFLLTIIINILISGAVYGLIYAIILAIKNKDNFKKEFLKINSSKNTKLLKLISLITVLILILPINFFFIFSSIRIISNILLVLLLLYPYLFTFVSAVEKGCMIKYIPASKLAEGDWLEQDIYKNKKLIYKRNPLGIDKKDIEKILKAKIKKVLIKEGIPFVPSFLIAIIFTLLYQEIFFIR